MRMWDTASWNAEPGATTIKHPYAHVELITEDLFACGNDLSGECELDRVGQAGPITRMDWPSMKLTATRGELIHVGDGRVFETATGHRLRAPVGRKFHPDLARFAPDRRFVGAFVDKEYVLIDPCTDKSFRAPPDWREMRGFGMVAAVERYGAPVELRLLPSADRFDFPAELLELWAQVAVRGEIGPDSSFVKWTESTWERKRQDLAARPAPRPDFPFPGQVANDRLHWLRQEYENASAADKPRLARELLDRAEAAGDKTEAARWRARVKQE